VYNARCVLPGVDLLRCLFKTYFYTPRLHVTQLHAYLKALRVHYFGVWHHYITRQMGRITVCAALLMRALHSFVSYVYILLPLMLVVLRSFTYKTCKGFDLCLTVHHQCRCVI